jgi:hypothetical protein
VFGTGFLVNPKPSQNYHLFETLLAYIPLNIETCLQVLKIFHSWPFMPQDWHLALCPAMYGSIQLVVLSTKASLSSPLKNFRFIDNLSLIPCSGTKMIDDCFVKNLFIYCLKSYNFEQYNLMVDRCDCLMAIKGTRGHHIFRRLICCSIGSLWRNSKYGNNSIWKFFVAIYYVYLVKNKKCVNWKHHFILELTVNDKLALNHQLYMGWFSNEALPRDKF